MGRTRRHDTEEVESVAAKGTRRQIGNGRVELVLKMSSGSWLTRGERANDVRHRGHEAMRDSDCGHEDRPQHGSKSLQLFNIHIAVKWKSMQLTSLTTQPILVSHSRLAAYPPVGAISSTSLTETEAGDRQPAKSCTSPMSSKDARARGRALGAIIHSPASHVRRQSPNLATESSCKSATLPRRGLLVHGIPAGGFRDDMMHRRQPLAFRIIVTFRVRLE